MGCDCINYDSCWYGYGLEFEKLFQETDLMVDEYKRWRMFEEKDSAYNVLRKKWKNYLKKFHPELDLKQLPQFTVTCTEFLGMYETEGLISECRIVFGYPIKKSCFTQNQSDADDKKSTHSLRFDFPSDTEEILLDFLARFYLKIREKKLIAKNITKTKKNLKKLIKIDVFGSLH